ncbi:META domain-containing protein [Flavobacterium sp.]|uniref:META domain-containing protein n=1 Tax=Flavobacterium sp. TaxID=239 RepID=UPI0026228796|nr:META domain-containing protein [Flavobacterium sp.]
MKRHLLIGFLLLTVIGCKSLDEKMENADQEAYEKKINGEIVYFKASGNDPFWNLTITNDSIELKSMASGPETFKIHHANPMRAEDSDVKMYRVDTELGKMNIQIIKGNCQNSKSGVISPYYVTTEFLKKADNKSLLLHGCGQYMTDERLNDVWVLEHLNGKTISVSDFAREFPHIEINTTSNTFSGFAGCNQMNGKIIFEKDALKFRNVITTKMMCAPKNKEAEFLKALHNVSTYTIDNNRLWLSSETGVQVVFKKID